MIRFDYKKPASLEECLELLNHYQGKARLFAGGTDLMVEFRADDKKLKDVEVVIDISNLPELKIIKLDEASITIGAAATFTEIINNPNYGINVAQKQLGHKSILTTQRYENLNKKRAASLFKGH